MPDPGGGSVQKWRVDSAPSTLPAPARIWRYLSVALVVGIVALTGLHLFRGIAASEQPAVAETATGVSIRVQGFRNPQDLQLQVLSQSSVAMPPVSRTGYARGVELPAAPPLVIAASRTSGELVGLAIVAPEAEPTAPNRVLITPRTTAHALVSTAPGVLQAGSILSASRLDDPSLAAPLGQLIAEVANAENLSAANPRLELRLAQVVDALGLSGPTPTECATGYRTAGACVQDTADGPLVSVGAQWVAVFPDAQITPCAILAPDTIDATIPAACGSRVVFAIDGPWQPPDGAEELANEGIVASQLAMASGVTAAGSYSIPFADLMLGASGAAEPQSEIGPQMRRSSADILALVTQTDGLRATEMLRRSETSATGRVEQRFALARLTIGSPRFGDLLRTLGAGYTPTPDGAAILAIHERSLRLRQAGRGLVNANNADMSWDLIDLAGSAAGSGR